MLGQLMPALRMTVVLTLLTGAAYPGLVTGLCKLLFPAQADGSLITQNGKVIGSALIGQDFTAPQYFHPRPSAAGYDASASTGSNLGPTSQKLVDRVKASVEAYRKENPSFTGEVPADAVTTSASGLDPHISEANAEVQMERVARARGVEPGKVREAVRRFTEQRKLGLLGEPTVNVLLLNLELDRTIPAPRS
jgi:potassium-transporting ATPase KdpC subunit